MSPNLRRATLADGGAQLHTYLARLEHLLDDGRPFLLGALPSIRPTSRPRSRSGTSAARRRSPCCSMPTRV